KGIEMNGPDTEIVLHGLSMGAATMLMTRGEDLSANVKAVLSDSAYTTVYDLFAYHMNRLLHLPRQPILPTTSVGTKLRADYGLKEASALEQVEKADLPVLYVAGDGDTFVPTNMTEELYEHTKHASLKVFPDANHGESIVMHRDKYIEAM